MFGISLNGLFAPKGKVVVPTPDPQPEIECNVYFRSSVTKALAAIKVKAYSVKQAIVLTQKECKDEIISPVFALIKGGKKDD